VEKIANPWRHEHAHHITSLHLLRSLRPLRNVLLCLTWLFSNQSAAVAGAAAAKSQASAL
jgi:hypothetical protein